MPNRIIKDSIACSEKINGLSDFHFRLWVHLITYVDDYGRADARAAIIKGRCFPLREQITMKDIEEGIAGLVGAGCISLYQVDGKSYLYFPNWDQHQRVRNRVSKFPAPESCGELPQMAADGGELPQGAARIQNPIQNPESESESGIQNPESGDFDRFWQVYPKKVGKKDARRAFDKVTVDTDTLISAVNRQKKSGQWCRDGGQFIPNPATWLRSERWNDELDTTMGARVPLGASGELGEAELEAIRRVLEE